MNFGDRNVDGNGFLAGLDFLLVAAMAKFALDFHVKSPVQCLCSWWLWRFSILFLLAGILVFKR